ncbi:MAG TPA: ABC-F family ATP-binding cassette domain-containing protein [bacterium]|nr:ABC-F family ATP-binding cassette domain-containing protein [bacterium]HPN30953.1 ABC-F family ATP-binding cassette domain-containing protein [bacterium]
MITVSNLSKYYGSQVLFDNITFTINKKERIGIVGRNGHGKSTLFKIILGIEESDSGKISVPNNYRIGYLEQHINFKRPTPLDEACLGLPPSEEHNIWKVEKILTGLGFSKDDMRRPINEFSGGYQVRINLAKTLISEPDMLLLDEPTNYLDIVSIRWLTKFLNQWQNELMLITHDRNFMDGVVTHILAIHRKKIKKTEGDTEKTYSQILKEEEIYEKTRINDEKKRKETELFITRFRAKARLANLVQSRIKSLEKQEKFEKLDSIKNIDFSFTNKEFPAKNMMEIENVSFSFDNGENILIDDFSITIGKNDRIGVIGRNGKGKTTLLRLITGELSPQSGAIKKHHLLETGYFGQTNIMRLNESNSALDEIMNADPDYSIQRARNICGALMFENDNALKKISVLSGGERSRVLLGKILVTPVNMLLLDEPTNHLDMESCDSLITALDSFDGAILIVTHNELYLNAIANRLIVFDRGKISVFNGGYQYFLESVGWEDDGSDKKSLKKKKEKIESADEINSAKEAVKLKNEMQKEKNKLMRPVENRIKELEKIIKSLETELNDNYENLVKASTEGAADIIASISKRNLEIQSLIEKNYEILSQETELYDSMKIQ